jgi:hypothetical protein
LNAPKLLTGFCATAPDLQNASATDFRVATNFISGLHGCFLAWSSETSPGASARPGLVHQEERPSAKPTFSDANCSGQELAGVVVYPVTLHVAVSPALGILALNLNRYS